MAFWSKWFQSAPKGEEKPVKSAEHKGFLIEARPYKEGGQFQLAGLIVKEVDGTRMEHRFIRADRFTDLDEAAETALAKGRLIIDQMGERIFAK